MTDVSEILERALEDERAELLREKLESASEKTRVLKELEACERLLARLRTITRPASTLTEKEREAETRSSFLDAR